MYQHLKMLILQFEALLFVLGRLKSTDDYNYATQFEKLRQKRNLIFLQQLWAQMSSLQEIHFLFNETTSSCSNESSPFN